MHKWLKMGAYFLGGLVVTSVTAKYVLQRTRNFSWLGKRVVITGASRGLGLVMARQLIDQGATVAICARTALDIDTAVIDLQSQRDARGGGQVFGSVCDVRKSDSVTGFIKNVLHHFGGIDVLINCAGIIEVGPFESMTEEDFRNSMDTNCWGTLNMIHQVAPIMKTQGWGRILNIASLGGQRAVPHMLPYSTSKFAMVGLSTGLRAELAMDNILVTTVCPGLMRTGSPRNASFKSQHRKEYAWFSIGDSLPLVSMNVEVAAATILRACQRGEPLVEIVGILNASGIISRIAPNWTIEFLSLMQRFLPRYGGIGKKSAKGYESTSQLSPSLLTRLSDKAAFINNEIRVE